MNKQDVYTIAGIVFSLVIASCGWILTNTLIDRHEATLLTAVGSIHDAITLDATTVMDNNADLSSNLSEVRLEEEVMSEILANWSVAGSYVRPHEPVEGQLTMKQAIAAAKSGLSYLSAHGVISPKLLEYEFTHTNASLCENRPTLKEIQSDMRVRIDIELPPEYSYWTITFDSERVSARLILNAVTGSIWRADIVWDQSETMSVDLDVLEMMDVYVVYLGLGAEDSCYSGDTWATKGFAGNTISVTVVKDARGSDNARDNSRISLYLSSFSYPMKYVDIMVETK